MKKTLTDFASEALSPKGIHDEATNAQMIEDTVKVCHHIYSDTTIELSDPDCIGKGHVADSAPIAFLSNPQRCAIHHLDMDTFLKKMARKQDGLPSCCDCLLWTETRDEVLLGELTASEYKYIDDSGVNYTDIFLGTVPNKEIKSKRAKAVRQLRNGVDIMARTTFGKELLKAPRKTAVFFFRRTDAKGVAGTASRAFSRSPIYTRRLAYPTDGRYPDWQFFSQPHPLPFVFG